MVFRRPSAAAREFTTRAWAILVMLALALGVTTVAAAPARAIESPPTGNTQFYQITGNAGSQTNGDPWTTQDGANSSFMIQIIVPQAWVTASRQVRIQLFSPSMPTDTTAGAFTVNSPAVVDEVRGAGPNSTTTFSFRNPSNGVLQTTAYAPSATDWNSWVTFGTFTPAVAGTYSLRVNSTGDDDNGFRLRVTDPAGVDDPDGSPGTGDELEIFNTQVVMQALGTVNACQNYSYFVSDGTASVTVRTFDMDGSGTVVTTRADGSTSTGANSAGNAWHADAVSVAAGQAGWWFTTVCLPSGDNAYAFDVVSNSFLIGDPPAHPVLAVTKSDGRTTAYRNDTLTYTIHVTNSGTGSAFGTTLADTLPAALTYVSCSLGTASGTCGASGQNVTATLTSTIAAGASVDLTVVATVNAAAPFAAVTNTAVIDFSDPDGHNYPTVQGADSTTIVRTPPTAGNAASTVNPDVNAVLTPAVTAGTGAITTIRFADGTITKTVAGQGTWTLTGTGTGNGAGALTATFDPLPAFRGAATQQSYVVTDANALTGTGTLDVTVRTEPVAANAAATVNPGVTATLNPAVALGTGALATVVFDNGLTAKTVPGQGTWSISLVAGQPVATFAPLAAFRGAATAQAYTVTDVFGLSSSGNLNVFVRTGPTAGNTSATVNPGVTATLNPAVTLGTGALASAVFDNGLATKTVPGEGTWSISLVSGQPVATFAPLAAFRGAATAQAYTVTDVFGITSSGTLNVTVRTGPTAGAASATVNPGVTAGLNPVVAIGSGALASVVFDNGLTSKTVVGEGTWSISLVSGQPVATFTPLAGFRGNAATQAFTVTDVNGLTSSANLDVLVRTGPAAGSASATVNPGVTATLNPGVIVGTGPLTSVVFGNGFSSITVVGEGSWSISLVSGQPVATFTPLAAFRGTATPQTYSVTDINGLASSGNLAVFVRTGPSASAASSIVNPGVTATLNPVVTVGTGVLASVVFDNGLTTKTVAGEGTWSVSLVSGQPVATFAPLAAFRGAATQQAYTVADVNGLASSANLDVTVRTGPSAGNDSATVNPGVTATLNPAVIVGTGALTSVVFDNGLTTKTVAGEGTWSISLVSGQPVATFAPLAAFRGAASPQGFTVTDVNGLASSGTLTVTVRTGPSAASASAIVNPGATATLNPVVVVGTGALTSVVFDNGFSSKTVVGEGSWSISLVSGQPVATFVPLAAFRGAATQQSYVVTDINALTASSTLDVFVRTGPAAGNASATVNPDVNAVLTPAVTVGSVPISTIRFADGTISKTVAGEGTWTLAGAGTGNGSGAFTATFDPLVAFRGAATQQSFIVTDANALTASGTLDVFVRTGPAANNASTAVNPGVTATLNPVVGAGTGAVVGVVLDNGLATKTVAGEGTWSIALVSGQPVATFAPLAAFRGSATTQPYTVTDANSLTASATLDVTVRTGPTAGDASATVNPGAAATLNPSVTIGSGPLASAVFDNGLTTKTVAGEGVWTISLIAGQPQAVFAPLAAFRGTATTQAYTATDVNGLADNGTLDVFVRTGPTAGDDSATVNPGVTATLSPAVIVGTGPLSAVTFDNGLASKVVAGEGTWTISLVAGQTAATFAPDPAFRGQATTQAFDVTDVNGLASTGHLDVMVRTGPTAGNDSATVNPGGTATLNPAVTPGSGALTGVTFDNASTTKTVAGEGTWSIALVSGQPVATFVPELTFRGGATQQQFTVTDVNGLASTGTLDVFVRTGPTAGNDSVTVNPGATAILNPVVTPGTGPLATVLFDNNSATKSVAGEGVWTISLVAGQPQAVYVPQPGFAGAPTPQHYVVTDVNGLSATGLLHVSVNGAPQAGDAGTTVATGVTAVLTPTITPGNSAITTITFADGTASKTVAGEGAWTLSGAGTGNGSGAFTATFVPEAGYSGIATSQAYRVTDTNGLTAAGLLSVTVTPTAVNDVASTPGGTLLTRDAANGVTPNDTGSGLQITSVVPVGAQHGTLVLNADGSFTFQPVQHFHGTVSYVYTTTDGDGQSVTATLTITVTADPPLVMTTAPTSECVADTPYLSWDAALPPGFLPQGANPLTITFINPHGEDYVVTGLPLTGTMLWPGAATSPKQWPGWQRLADGTYVETTGNFAWTRTGVQVKFEVNPEYITTIAYPPATAACADVPVELRAEDTAGGDSLSSTGATAGAFVPWAGGLLLLGGFFLVLARRRREAS